MLQRFAKRNWYVDLKKYEKTLISLSERCLKDEEGNVLVTLCPAPLFDPMHGDPQRDLNHDIYTSLDDQAFLIPLKERIHVVLQCEYDKEVIPLFHRHYEEKMLGKKRELRFNTLKTIYLLLLGFLLLGISYITKLASSSGFVGSFSPLPLRSPCGNLSTLSFLSGEVSAMKCWNSTALRSARSRSSRNRKIVHRYKKKPNGFPQCH